jgi:U3 small nucleolar RNA-associated protein 15
LIEELIERNGLERALQGRTEEALIPLLRFVTSHITHPHYSSTLSAVANVLLDIYGNVIAKSEVLQIQLNKMMKKLEDERKTVSSLCQVLGMMDLVFSNSSKTTELQVTWKESDEEILRRVMDAQTEQTLRDAEDRMRQMEESSHAKGDSSMEVDHDSDHEDTLLSPSRLETVHSVEVEKVLHSQPTSDAEDLHGYLEKIQRGEELGISFGGEWSSEQARDQSKTIKDLTSTSGESREPISELPLPDTQPDSLESTGTYEMVVHGPTFKVEESPILTEKGKKNKRSKKNKNKFTQ